MGAEKCSSISGELTAIAELLWHILFLITDVFFKNNNNLIIFVDCTYVKDILGGKVTSIAHPLLVVLVQHLWGVVKEHLFTEVRWCRAHRGIVGNERANKLAEEGRLAGHTPSRAIIDPNLFDAPRFQSLLQDL